MSKREMIESGSKWVEEDLNKLSFKDLKKLAKENSIRANPNSRKADLVKALLNSSTVNVSLIDKSDIMETDKRVRMTRSRASIFQPLCAMQDDLFTSNKTSDNRNEEEQFDKEMESSHKAKRKNKNKIKSEIKIDVPNEELVSSNPTEIFNIVSSVQKNRPLTEITNNDVLSKKESKQTNGADNKNLSKRRRRKGKNLAKSSSTENLNFENKQVFETQFFKNESDETKKEEINSSIAVTCDERKIVKKSKGKKAKVTDERVAGKVESAVEEPTTNNQSENEDAENNKTFEIPYHEDSLDSEKERNNFPITIADNKKPQKKTGGRGKKSKDRERNFESEEICSNVTTELSVDSQTEEFFTNDNSPVEDKKRRKRNRNKSHEMENSAQNSNSSLPPKDGQCDTKKQRLRKTSKENTSVKKEEPVLADSLMMPETKNKSLTSKTESNSIMSDINEFPSTSNSRRNIKNTKSESESKSSNSKLRVNSPQNTNPTESLESNKSSTEKTPDIANMPVRTSNVSSVTTDSAGTSRKTRSSQNMSKFEPPLRSSTFIIEEGAGGQTPRSSLSKNQSDLPSCSNTFLVEEEALQTKTTPVQLAPKVEKSIGSRILSVSMKKGNVKPLVKLTSGSSTVKKSSITKAKNTNTPGSVYKSKFGVAKRPPNFKSIHQKLFKNMESIDENKQRTMARAQAFLASPAPRCALLSPKTEVLKHSTSSKKAPSSNFLSPLVRTPIQSIQKDKTVPKRALPSPSVNRFGFKKPVKRLDSSTIKNKLPNTSLAKIKDQERQILQGVRMNKRFLLQMKMREGK